MIYFFSAYFSIGILFGWFWFFRHRRRGAMVADYLFYLLLIVVWPFPMFTEILPAIGRK